MLESSSRNQCTAQRGVRWGIIGCGDVVERKSGPSFQTVAGSTLVAVMRRSRERVKEYATRHGVPFWTTDAQKVIDHPEVDAIYIATPPDHHLEYVLRVCEAGKPCLVEKPVGRSATESARMVAAFRARSLPIFAAYYRRYLPKYEKVKELLDSGQLGRIVALSYRFSMPALKNNWRMSPRVGGGGLFFDLGCHVLDLLDYWFGPLDFRGGGAINASPAHEAEDAVSLSFQTQGGALGTALWNFAGVRTVEVLEIEGLWGKLILACMDPWSPVVLELITERARPPRATRTQRLVRKLKGQKKPKRVTSTYAFESIPYVHQPMVEAIVDAILADTHCRVSGEAAVRTSHLMDQALSGYYTGREDSFWERPSTWHSLRATACQRADQSAKTGQYALSEPQRQFFAENGYLGPFKCEAPGWDRIHVPRGDHRLNLHLKDPQIFELCTHPGIVNRVSQLLGPENGISLMKTRIWVKSEKDPMVVPWHQDVGLNNGGVRDDGSPVPTVTVWLSIDGANRQGGAVQVIPGSHRYLLGDWKMGLLANLQVNGLLNKVDMNSAVTLETGPGEFYIFHSWILHGSEGNRLNSKRTALNMRFTMRGDEFEPKFEYVPVTSPLDLPVVQAEE
jgi:1,5-anhydro-D-fructose reductase (1,5-anhydro-D-mannitol-forming)